MDVREKLVELLAGCPCESDCEGMVGSCPHRKNGNCNEIFKLSYCAVSKLAQHLITHGVTVQEWISVMEMEPEITGWFLTFGPQRKTAVVHFDSDGVWSDEDDYNIDVTHWMPMPQPPKGE